VDDPSFNKLVYNWEFVRSLFYLGESKADATDPDLEKPEAQG